MQHDVIERVKGNVERVKARKEGLLHYRREWRRIVSCILQG